MSTLEMLLCLFYGIIGVTLALVARTEWRAWSTDRLDATLRPKALHRFSRRMTGIFILVLVLVLLRYPADLPEKQMIFKISLCLLLCFVLFVLALWDLRTVRRQLNQEVKEFMDNSSSEFEQYLQNHLQKKKS